MKINIHTPFNLNIDGVLQHFKAGLHEVEEAIASHWMVKAHTTDESPAAEPAAEQAPTVDETPEPVAETAPAVDEAAPAVDEMPADEGSKKKGK